MDITSFILLIIAAASMGIAIGLERQWGHHRAGLRTNALVAFGSCLYVSLPSFLGGSPTSAHLAGQVVVGIGFMCGGVILKEGVTVHGLNTAATIWCSAAVGALAGAGLLLEGVAGTVGILILNVALRPVSDCLDRRTGAAKACPMMYRLRAACRADQQARVQGILLDFFNDQPTMTIQRHTIQDDGEPDRACVVADIYAAQQNDQAMADITTLVKNEPSVTSVSCERNPPT
jgi:putative Mg2+ transporter-C (MgtC) family protein